MSKLSYHAIWNYPVNGKHTHQHQHLSLFIGEVVHVQQECQHWYYGYRLTNEPNKLGVFPRNYIQIQNDASLDGDNNNYNFEQETILILYEWINLLKKIFENGDMEKYSTVRNLILPLIEKYQLLKSGKLTTSELKKLRIDIIDTIDLGNKHLNLDLIVRDHDGSIIDPFERNIIEYFEYHWEKSQKLRSIFRNSNDSNSSIRQESSLLYTVLKQSENDDDRFNYNNCYNFCITLSNFICMIKQDMIINMAIYDAGNHKFITENYIVKWEKTGFVREVEKINNIRVVFTDFSANDLFHSNSNSKQLYLVCQVIRVGTMHIVDHDRMRKATYSMMKKPDVEELKRPCGVAVYSLNDVINNHMDQREKKEIFVPLVMYSERDSLDSLLRKVIRDPKDAKDMCKTQGFIISILLFASYKMQLLDKYRMYYAQYPSYIARKIGFRDIILPEDVRNDLYLTLVSGEFHKGSKKSERNIEVTVKIIDENGMVINDCLAVDSHNTMDSLYRSVVYYHEDKPKWMETIKIVLPTEKFPDAHLKFTFKHRSSNENKDKNEKPFAIAFIKLMNADETTLANQIYRPFIYKIDSKKINENDKSYLSYPSCKNDLKQLEDNNNVLSSNSIESLTRQQPINKQKLSTMYVHSARDIFTISVVVCSTKLTQNIQILSLLGWKENKISLNEILMNVQKLEGSEIMKFLYDVLNALFEIWMDPYTRSDYDRQIFDALIYIIKHLLQDKYIHFQEILNEYIEKHFSATLIHMKLIESFKYYIENPDSIASYHTVTCMEFIFKFIIRSRNLYVILNGDKNRDDFETALEDLFELFTRLMDIMETKDEMNGENIIKVKLGILKYFPKIIKNVLTIFDERKLAMKMIKLIKNIPCTELSVQKLSCIHEIVESELYSGYPECRRKLVPTINVHLQTALVIVVGENFHHEKLEKCLAIISDALKILIQQKDLRIIKYDINDFVQILLQPMIDTFLSFQMQKRNENTFRHKMWSIIIAIMYQMTDYHYNEFFNRLKCNHEFEQFIRSVLKIFDHATKLIYPTDWSYMNITQNVVILKAMTRIINFTKEKIYFDDFSIDTWNQLFLISIKFITQPSLMLESFTFCKRKRMEKNFNKDMRLEMIILIRSLWFHLGNHKAEFIPSLIGPLLQVALIPMLAIRKDTIVIFFDMFLCMEKMAIFRDEMLTQMDLSITAGKGDRKFKQLLTNMFIESSENHEEYVKENFEKFVAEIGEQIEKLLIYRNVVKNVDNYESLMSAIIDLLDFYERIDRRELYIRYLYKLYDLHIRYENYNEAAYTLSRHSILLEWSDKQLEQLLRQNNDERFNNNNNIYNSHRELKEKLYFDIIENFNKGQLWEAGIVYCKELIQQYENEIFDYVKLSSLFEKMASFYKLIISSVRIEPEYFHVTYYGKAFSTFFQNKSFIYRGKSYERLFEFTKRLQNQFPQARLLDKLDIQESELANQNDQYLSIYRVDPKVSDEVKNKFLQTLVDERIIKYYQYNEINRFTFSRKLIKDAYNHDVSRPVSNEFACMWIERSEYRTAFSLPGILYRSEIIEKFTYQLNPLKNAIDTMEKMNEKTRMIIYRYLLDDDNKHPLHNLLMHIKGIVSSDVQGGVSKYEEAFFDNDNNNKHDDEYDKEDLDHLRRLIVDQIPLLDLAIKIADQKQRQHVINQSMDGLYQYIVESFEKMRNDVRCKYEDIYHGDLPADMQKIIENHYKMQRLTISMPTDTAQIISHRNSIDGTMTLTKRSLFGRSNTNAANTLTNTLRFRRKDSRRLNPDSSNSICYSSNANISQTQWYTDHHKKSTGNLSFISDTNNNNNEQQQSPSSNNQNENFNKSSRISSRPSSGNYSSSRTSIQSQLSVYYPMSTSSISLEEDQDELPPELPDKKNVYQSPPELPSHSSLKN
ncbi:dedicator of cytokinesis protein 1-like protein [Dermatophagoides farinae]|uniref:Dedicator of cytokinesis protein 1-like protein n=1 Tax=Dermatophagoides farinae TaxID=6954 RepID=A0A9D4SIR1_DERFA|nr:dedicator of cytokinesis protein 1-like protein [Dermatophagoides farinae]